MDRASKQPTAIDVVLKAAKELKLSLYTNPHVQHMSVDMELQPYSGGWDLVTRLRTDLQLNVQHPQYDKGAVDSVIADAEEYMRAPGFAGGRIRIEGI